MFQIAVATALSPITIIIVIMSLPLRCYYYYHCFRVLSFRVLWIELSGFTVHGQIIAKAVAGCEEQ